MVEELKLAVKVDDDIIEQSLLKQFNNAEKLADKVVFTFKNVNLDNKEIEKQFKDMQKLAGKNPIELPIDTDKSLKMLQALGDEFTRIISIAKGLDGIKTDFGTKNKTEAYNQLKQMADVFKKFYGNEEVMHSKAGTDAAYAYYKAYEEALKKGVAQSRLESVTVDVDPEGYFNANRLSSDRIKDFESFKKYGGELTELSTEISFLESRLLKFGEAFSKVSGNLGEANITPDILKNIEEYVRYLEIAESRAKDADLMGFSKDDINDMNNLANMYLGFAIEDAIQENEKYKSSLKEVREEKEKTDEVIKHSSTSTVGDFKFDELKADVTEIREELNGVKEKISAIDSEGFEHVKADVEKTVESVKELNSELTEVKLKLDSTSTSPVETNISSPIKDTFQGGHSDNSEASGVKQYKKKGYKAHDTGNHDNERKVANKKELSRVLKELQTEIIASIDESTQFVKEVTDFYDSQDNLVKTQMKIGDKNGSMSTYTTSYSTDKEGNSTAWTSHITTEKVAEATKQASKEIQAEWDKNVKAIQEYMDANTKLNNLKAQDAGTGKKAKEIEYNVKKVEELEKAAIEARATLSSMINHHEAPIDDWNKWLDVMKQFDQAAVGSAESLAKLEDSLRNMAESQFKKVSDTLSNSEKYFELLKPTEGNRSVKFEGLVQEYDKAVNSLKEFHATLDTTTPLTKEQSEKFEELAKKVKDARTEIDKIPKALRGSDEDSRMKEIDKLTKYLDANTRISKEAKQQLQGYLALLKSGDPSVSVKELHTAWTKVAVAEREAGREGKRFFDILSDKALYGQAAQLAGYYLSLTDFIRYGKQVIDTVIEIDTAMTELQKVSNATSKRLEENFKNSAETAKDLGASISEVISASADWSKMGFNIDEAEELARVSTLYVNVGDGIDVEEANNSLISTLQGFQMDAEEAESIIDRFNEVANNYAIDSAGIGEALQRSAASFNAANTDLSKSIALITATNEVVQDPDSVGTLWKTMSARIRGASTELAELSEETDEYTESTSKLRDLVKGLTGFDIMADEDTFKDIYEIILGIGKEWNNLTDVEQASLGEALAGKRNANALYAVLGNLDTLEEAYKTAEESAGSAMREQENYEQHIQYSLDRLTASAQEWAATLVDSGVIKWFVDLANAIVEVSTVITPLGTLALGGGLFAGIKNVGTTNYISCRQNCVLF